MMFSLVPAFSGMMALSFLPTDSMKWTRWGMYILQVFGSLPGLSKFIPVDSSFGFKANKLASSDLDFPALQRRRPYKEDGHLNRIVHRLLHWQLYWSSDHACR